MLTFSSHSKLRDGGMSNTFTSEEEVRNPGGLLPAMEEDEWRMGRCSSCGDSNSYRSAVVKREPSWQTVNRSALIPTLIFVMGCDWHLEEYDHKYKLPLRVGWWGGWIRTPLRYSVFDENVWLGGLWGRSRTFCWDYKSYGTRGHLGVLMEELAGNSKRNKTDTDMIY